MQQLPASKIPGATFYPNLLPETVQEEIVEQIAAQKYFGPSQDQCMLFETSSAKGQLPPWTGQLIRTLSDLLHDKISNKAKELFFPAETSLQRQLIINTYRSGQGIASHVDLLRRFGDGVIICSFLSGIAMDLDGPRGEQTSLWLKPGSVLLLSEEARYEWKHGISARQADRVQVEDAEENVYVRTVQRDYRLSVTIRWMLQNGGVLAEDSQLDLRVD